MIRILFIEDDSVQMSNLRRSLSIMKNEWEMRFCASAEDGLVELADRKFDVVVTDFAMPGMNGIELLSLTQYMYPQIVRVLLSDAGQSGAAVRGAGVAHRILRKPFDPVELAVAIMRTFELEQRLNDPDLQDAIGRIGVLPSPRGSVLKLNDLFGRDETSIDEVAEVVAADVSMTAKLLQVVNSAYFGLTHHIADVREAIAYLGLDAVRNVTVATELMRSLEGGSALVQSSIDEIHEHSLTVAHIARELMPERSRATDAFVAAMLHDVGQLVIAAHMPERYLEIRVQAMRSNLCLTEVESEILGATHTDIGAHLLDLWGLPYEIVEAVARHHDAPDLAGSGMEIVHAVYIADALTNAQEEREGVWEHDGELDPEYLDRVGMTERVSAFAD